MMSSYLPFSKYRISPACLPSTSTIANRNS